MRKWVSIDLLALASAAILGLFAATLNDQNRSRNRAQLQAGHGTRGVTPPDRAPLPADTAAQLAGIQGRVARRGWWRLGQRVIGRITAHRIMTEAAGVTFFALLAIFPALAAMVSLYGLFADPAAVSAHLDAMSDILPGGGLQLIEDQVTRVAANGNRTLGFGLIVGLATSLWSANAAMKAMFDSLNVVYDTAEQRGYLRLTVLSLSFTLIAILFMVIALAGVVALPVALNFVGLGSETDLMLRVGRWPALMLVIIFGLSLIYRFGPCRTDGRWRWISAGGAFASIGWIVVSAGFSWYVTNFGSYNKTYGSLGAAVGFMTWIWLSAIVVLIGAEVDADAEGADAGNSWSEPDA